MGHCYENFNILSMIMLVFPKDKTILLENFFDESHAFFNYTLYLRNNLLKIKRVFYYEKIFYEYFLSFFTEKSLQTLLIIC